MTTIQKLQSLHKRIYDIYPSISVTHKPHTNVAEQQITLIKGLKKELQKLEADSNLLKEIPQAKSDFEKINNKIYQIKGYLHLLEKKEEFVEDAFDENDKRKNFKKILGKFAQQ